MKQNHLNMFKASAWITYTSVLVFYWLKLSHMSKVSINDSEKHSLLTFEGGTAKRNGLWFYQEAREELGKKTTKSIKVFYLLED